MRTTQKVVAHSVATYFGIEPIEIFRATRKKPIRWPRQLFHYLSAKWTNETLGGVGRYGENMYNKKRFDHATVHHSKKTISNLLDVKDKEAWESVIAIEHLMANMLFIDCDMIPLDIDLIAKCEKYTESFI